MQNCLYNPFCTCFHEICDGEELRKIIAQLMTEVSQFNMCFVNSRFSSTPRMVVDFACRYVGKLQLLSR